MQYHYPQKADDPKFRKMDILMNTKTDMKVFRYSDALVKAQRTLYTTWDSNHIKYNSHCSGPDLESKDLADLLQGILGWRPDHGTVCKSPRTTCL